jgi:hypothetical protein
MIAVSFLAGSLSGMAVAFLRGPMVQFYQARAHIQRETVRKSHFANRRAPLSALMAGLLGFGGGEHGFQLFHCERVGGLRI